MVCLLMNMIRYFIPKSCAWDILQPTSAGTVLWNSCAWKVYLEVEILHYRMEDDKLILAGLGCGERLSLVISINKSVFMDVFSLRNINQSNGR